MRGGLYGFGIWMLGVIPYEVIDIQTTRIPTPVWVNNFLFISLLWMVATGVVVGFFYPRRGEEPAGLWRSGAPRLSSALAGSLKPVLPRRLPARQTGTA